MRKKKKSLNILHKVIAHRNPLEKGWREVLPRYSMSSLPAAAEQGRCDSEQVKCRSSSLGGQQGDAEQGD